jgi:CheY-like chemotaxis protein
MTLLMNAAEAIPASRQGFIDVRTTATHATESYLRNKFAPADLAPGTYVRVEVHDTGSGMTGETVSRIYDPFFSTKFAGRGLGLAAALGIIRAHKGAMRAESTAGVGSTFTLLLPVTEAAGKESSPAEEKTLGGTGTVLFIDDEEIVRKTAKAMLERFGYAVVLAENGRYGVDVYQEMGQQISVVVLDLTMPVMGGVEALAQLRAINPDVKVILSSGYDEIEATQRFVGRKLAGFIQKPYRATELPEKIREVLKAKST